MINFLILLSLLLTLASAADSLRPPNDGKFFYMSIRESESNDIEGAALVSDIKVGADRNPFTARISSSAYNIGLDSFTSATAEQAYNPATSDSAFPANFKMSLPHDQMSSLYDDNTFPFHYKLFKEEIHLQMSKFNRDTSFNVAFANRDYYQATNRTRKLDLSSRKQSSGYIGLAPWTRADGQDKELNLLWQLMEAKKITYPIVSVYVHEDDQDSTIKLGGWDQIGV